MFPVGVLGSARAAASGGGWAPTDLGAALYAWYDASDSASITASSGLVSQWGDKSTNARNLNITPSPPTTGATTINGLNVINFTQKYITSAVQSAISQPITIALVGHQTALRASAYFLSLNGTTAFGAIGRGAGNFVILGPDALTHTIGVNISAPPRVHVGIFNSTSSAYRIDGSQVTGNVGSGSGNRVIVGSYTTQNNGFTGYVAEIVIATGALSGADLTSLETYLADKWGI